jgi:homoserine O-acetyltransferase
MNTLKLKYEFQLESGAKLTDPKIGYHTYGKLNSNRSNVIWVFHALTANSDVMDWWSGLFGTDNLFNPKEHFIICANVLGSPYGTSAPLDLDFPNFTVRDVVNLHLELAKHLDIQKIAVAIGGSFGGAQALEFSYNFTGKIEKLILLACSAKESAWGIAAHESQRLSIESDSTFGEPDGGKVGMKAARSAALLTYRTSESFIATQTDTDEKIDSHKASSYIQYQGDKFVNRFNSLSYYYLSKCLDSHNIGRERGGEEYALSKITIPSLVIGIQSDVLVPVKFQQFLAEHLPNASYKEVESKYGHDGFLVETEKISQVISEFLNADSSIIQTKKRTVLKFGGTSLANGKSIQSFLKIIGSAVEQESLAVVVSAKGDSTDRLENIYSLAVSGQSYSKDLASFIALQRYEGLTLESTSKFEELAEKLQALSVLQVDSEQVKNELLAIGELVSAAQITSLLNSKGLKAEFIDSRKFLWKDENGSINFEKSKKLINEHFRRLEEKTIPVMTGYIVSNAKGQTCNLGRNGSNYSATLLASFIGAKEVQNWTNINGVYSAHPKFVKNPTKISHLSYREANELANFGANILHAKTIKPLISAGIPLRIKSTLEPEAEGTLISKNQTVKGMKAVSVIEDVALVKIQGSGLVERIGIDGRIFSTLGRERISIKVISQASSERGIGFVIDQKDQYLAQKALLKEFEKELKSKEVSSITVDTEMSIIAILGRHNYSLEKAIGGLRRNRIWLHLISNSISGEHISLVVENKNLTKAVKVVHNEVFGARKTLNVFAFGKGTVGSKFLDQVTSTSLDIEERRRLKIRLVGAADSSRAVFYEEGLSADWRNELERGTHSNEPIEIINRLRNSGFENVVVVDNTSSEELTLEYPNFINSGFDVVASNKKANSMDYSFYQSLRKSLKVKGKQFLYETNVGAGLPIIDTLKHLYDSADNVTRVSGVFSGSLSYIFNQFSEREVPFSQVMLEAREKGFTEPDPREDLNGMDVARKLLILARELGSVLELKDIKVENLVPEALQRITDVNQFLNSTAELDAHYAARKAELQPNHVFRYTGDLNLETETLTVSLVEVEKESPLGSIKNADAIFEIFTETYGEQPMVIQGAGAGAAVTARGVYSDLLRLSRK